MTRTNLKKEEMSLLKRTIDKFRHGLVLQVVRNKLARVGFEFRPYYWVQEGINQLEVPNVKGSVSEYKVEFLNEEDMKIIGENARGYPEEMLLSWLKDGRKCIALKHKDVIATFMWINLNDCKYKPDGIQLNEEEAYLTDMYTMEVYRGKNLAANLRYQSYDILNKMGRYKLFSVSEYFNSSAIKYKKKLYAKNLKLILFIELFNKFKWSFTLKSY